MSFLLSYTNYKYEILFALEYKRRNELRDYELYILDMVLYSKIIECHSIKLYEIQKAI